MAHVVSQMEATCAGNARWLGGVDTQVYECDNLSTR